ncbi:MAG: metallopeptidase family protein [Alphaproteobacteria bacterium]|nr:metallopeptidase family protein [Alphaproteobacteria bacterium]
MDAQNLSKYRTKSITSLPDIADFYVLAQRTIDSLPEKFQILLDSLCVKVENFSDEQTLGSLKIKDKYDLLGLYRGLPVSAKKSEGSVSMPDLIYLYRGPLIRYARDNGETLEKVVRHVMVHEISYHFGFTDYDVSWAEQTST